MQVIDTKSLKDHLDSFFDIESLGTYCNPKCGGCRCGKCNIGNGKITIQEEHELQVIDAGLKYVAFEKYWTVAYPWKEDPIELPNNFKAALGRLNRLNNDFSVLVKNMPRNITNK